jgi:hypothetical protein
MNKSEFEFELKESVIEYANNGEKVAASYLTLKAPSPKQTKFFMKLRQFFMQALKENVSSFNTSGTSKTDNDNAELKGEDVMSMILMSSVDTDKMLDIFESLLPDVCLLDGKVSILPYMIKQIYPDEMGMLLGDYLANFIVPSQKKTN